MGAHEPQGHTEEALFTHRQEPEKARETSTGLGLGELGLGELGLGELGAGGRGAGGRGATFCKHCSCANSSPSTPHSWLDPRAPRFPSMHFLRVPAPQCQLRALQEQVATAFCPGAAAALWPQSQAVRLLPACPARPAPQWASWELNTPRQDAVPPPVSSHLSCALRSPTGHVLSWQGRCFLSCFRASHLLALSFDPQQTFLKQPKKQEEAQRLHSRKRRVFRGACVPLLTHGCPLPSYLTPLLHCASVSSSVKWSQPHQGSKGMTAV